MPIDAMGGKGELRVRTYREDTCVVVEIRDNGPGIPPEIKPHIFEPFFTTKGVGEGTGLGLDTVQRIVKKHRGNIQVNSSPGDTRFQVWLPLAGGFALRCFCRHDKRSSSSTRRFRRATYAPCMEGRRSVQCGQETQVQVRRLATGRSVAFLSAANKPSSLCWPPIPVLGPDARR